MDKIQEIVDFWFEGVSDETRVQHKDMPFKKWFSTIVEVDEEIKTRFEEDLEKARQGAYQEWEQSAKGCLALLILFDQFTRNLYRNTPKMYENDAMALALANQVIDQGKNQELMLIERVFIYMPLMHAEDLAAQTRAIQCFQKLVKDSKGKSPHNTHYFQSNLQYAQKYYRIIKEHGHFPHRKKSISN